MRAMLSLPVGLGWTSRCPSRYRAACLSPLIPDLAVALFVLHEGNAPSSKVRRDCCLRDVSRRERIVMAGQEAKDGASTLDDAKLLMVPGQRTDKRGSVASALSLIPSSATYPAYQSAAGGRYTPPRRGPRA
jgi:hypothetical protein